jgi:hypothetical protein
MDKVDVLYYINLDYRTDRRLEFLDWIEESGFPENKVERIQAVATPLRGHIGCLLSHIKTLETFLASGKEICLVFEDDYKPVDLKTFWGNFDKLFSCNKKFDIVLCSYNVLKSENTEVDFLHRVSHSYTSSGYLITRTFAPRLLENFKEAVQNILNIEMVTKQKCNEFCLDVHWAKLMPTSEWFCFYPKIGIQRESFSDIDNVYVNRLT